MRLVYFLLGAAIGASTRYAIVEFFRSNYKFPIGVLIANISGSFILGMTASSKTTIAYGLMGFCGALTTWSAFAIDLHKSSRDKDFRSMLSNLFLNYGLGIGAAMLGIWIQG